MPLDGEPLWLDDDRLNALALCRLNAETCACGQPQAESMNPANEGAYDADALKCFACAAIAKTSRSFHSTGGDAAGLMLTVHKKET